MIYRFRTSPRQFPITVDYVFLYDWLSPWAILVQGLQYSEQPLPDDFENAKCGWVSSSSFSQAKSNLAKSVPDPVLKTALKFVFEA